ncbi:plasma membrane protein Pth11-like protein [Hypoxylon crocopeplum]|nr:plasma membrane protein Pth11-like protein [Hypoxylon crocopeplum]
MAVVQKYYETPGHIKQRQTLKADDWLILPATLLTIGIGVSFIYGVSQRTLGYPTELPVSFDGNPLELKTKQMTMVAQLQWSFDLMVPLALGCVKASFLFFYQRIFAVDNKSVINYLLVGLIVLVFAWSAAFVVAFLFQCKLNFFAIWDSAMDLINYCNGSMNLALSLCITDFIFDIIIIVLPIPLIWRLNLSTWKKVAVCAVFLLGAAYANGRVVVITEYLYWGIVECGVSIFAACLPSLQFIFRGWSWDSFVRTTKSIFSYNQSRSQLPSTVKQDIHVSHEYDIAYMGNSNVLSRSQPKLGE